MDINKADAYAPALFLLYELRDSLNYSSLNYSTTLVALPPWTFTYTPFPGFDTFTPCRV